MVRVVRVLCSSVVLANGHIMFVKAGVDSQRVEKVEKEAEWMCGVCVRAGSAGRGVGPKARAQSATRKDRPFLLAV